MKTFYQPECKQWRLYKFKTRWLFRFCCCLYIPVQFTAWLHKKTWLWRGLIRGWGFFFCLVMLWNCVGQSCLIIPPCQLYTSSCKWETWHYEFYGFTAYKVLVNFTNIFFKMCCDLIRYLMQIRDHFTRVNSHIKNSYLLKISHKTQMSGDKD